MTRIKNRNKYDELLSAPALAYFAVDSRQRLWQNDDGLAVTGRGRKDI
jgi:hypothetical protein